MRPQRPLPAATVCSMPNHSVQTACHPALWLSTLGVAPYGFVGGQVGLLLHERSRLGAMRAGYSGRGAASLRPGLSTPVGRCAPSPVRMAMCLPLPAEGYNRADSQRGSRLTNQTGCDALLGVAGVVCHGVQRTPLRRQAQQALSGYAGEWRVSTGWYSPLGCFGASIERHSFSTGRAGQRRPVASSWAKPCTTPKQPRETGCVFARRWTAHNATRWAVREGVSADQGDTNSAECQLLLALRVRGSLGTDAAMSSCLPAGVATQTTVAARRSCQRCVGNVAVARSEPRGRLCEERLP